MRLHQNCAFDIKCFHIRGTFLFLTKRYIYIYIHVYIYRERDVHIWLGVQGFVANPPPPPHSTEGQGCVAPGLVKEARCGPEPILRSLTSAPNAGNLHSIGERDPGQRSVPGYLRVVATALPSLRTGKLIPYPSRALLRNNFSNLSFVSVH